MGFFRNHRRTIAMLLGLGMTVTAAAPAFVVESYAAVPKLNEIRVALFIDSGKSYKVVVPAVTLLAEQGLDIGNRQPNGARSWLTTSPGVPVRASVDGYKVLVAETLDAAQAEALAKALQPSDDKPFVFRSLKAGKPVYRIYSGMYTSVQLAEAAKQRIGANAAVAAQLRGAVPAVAGPLHGTAGTFATEAAAKPVLDMLLTNGMDAFLTVVEQGGQTAYAVWVGEAVDETQLNALKQQALKLNVPLQTADRNAPYLLKREEVTAGVTGVTAARGADHFVFGTSASGQKVWVTAKDGIVQVDERSKRRYRGAIELTEFNGSLAVVNELPFEQYVASVVGTELNNSWPTEVLKAQAVAARTFAIKQGMKYQIAHISDSTVDQAYSGLSGEGAATIAAANATAGELVLYKGEPISPFYYSNAGGMTGDAVEVWGTPVDYIAVKPSPDEIAAAGKLNWARVVLADGTLGYIRSDYVTDTGRKSPAGLPIVAANDSGVALRQAPYVDDVKNAAIARVNKGDLMTRIGQDPQSTEYAWIRGPFTGPQLLDTMNGIFTPDVVGPLISLKVSKIGPSGRVTELQANGKTVTQAKPDNYRTALGGLPSTRFNIEETGKLAIAGAGGQVREVTGTAQTPVYVLSGSQTAAGAKLQSVKGSYYVLGGSGQVRPATPDAQFRMIGKGFGHGLGMSQWGARGLAETGYDYKSILQYYYNGVTISKD
ncbi:SpoIID/LytB domain-containing protein [Paenibacillus koleovorans]|uniref:SpoIID/LytB domain-containing protein n=1 Tax=Paenibacillus koleovorans TaxID=121608 RepID=UPI000FDA8D93|nr:SpoIID/LytB domain-containing protein [Paenibacillus koleovorans]